MSLPEIDKKGQEPPMYLQRPSSARSQDVTHVLAQTFRQMYTRDTVGPDTVNYLHQSRGGEDDYHEIYVQALKQVQEEHERRIAEAAMLERHIMQAQARAMSADERALNRLHASSQGFPDLGLPPPRSHFRSCIDSALLRKHNLITPEDFATEELPVVPAPAGPQLPNYATGTASTSQRKADGQMDSETPVSPLIRDEESPQFDLESSMIDFTPRVPVPGQPLNDNWKEEMSPESREINRIDLKNLQRRVDYLKNPRHIPPSAPPGGRTLIKQQKKKPKEIGIKAKLEKDRNKEPSTVFIPSPSAVVFSDYTVGKVYELTLELKNVTTVLRPVRILPPKTSYFSVGLGQFPGEQGLIAPGMSCHFTIQFAPDSLGDFDDELVVQTQSSTPLVVKVLGRRPPPQLSLPETMDVGQCLVGGIKLAQFQVRNDGGNGRFCLLPRSSWPTTNFKSMTAIGYVDLTSFEIRPSVFELNKGESVMLEILFAPMSTETFTEGLTVVCDNCQVRHFNLRGEGQIPRVEVVSVEGGLADPEPGELCDVTAQHLIKFDPLNPYTYVQRTLTVQNPVNVELPYSWIVVKPCLKAEDPANPEEKLELPLQRYQDVTSAFNIEPQDGMLQPSGTAEFVVTYAPSEIGDFHSVLHLVLRNVPKLPPLPEETGKDEDGDSQERAASATSVTSQQQSQPAIEPPVGDSTILEIAVKSQCVPLSVVLQPYAISVPGQILVETSVKRQFRMFNQSNSPILFQWESISDEYILEVEPPVGEMAPQSEVDMELTVSGSKPGVIDHTLFCHVQHLAEPAALSIHAEIKGPEVVIEQSDVNFGLVRLGESETSFITLRNTCRVPAQWTLKEDESVQEDSEFIFSKMTGELKPLEAFDIEVTFTPRSCRSLRTIFTLHIQDGNESALSVRAEVQNPAVCLLQCQLAMTEVYVNMPVCHQVSLLNQTLLPTTFEWGELEGADAESCTVSIEPASGDLQPREQLEVNLHLTAKRTGEMSDLRLPCKVAGMEAPLYLALITDVRGLSVSYRTPQEELDSCDSENLKIDLGQCKVGDNPKRYVYIKNESGIPAPFSVVVQNFKARPPTPPNRKPQDGLTFSKSQRRAMLAKTPNLADPHTRPPARVHSDLCKAMLREGKGAAFTINPSSGILQPFGEELIEVTGYSDVWGLYTDTLVCKVEQLEETLIPVKMSVTGCPLMFQMMASQPTKVPILRFGTHVSGVNPVPRQMKINNSCPYDVRLDWQMFNVHESDHRLLDFIVSYGNPFPLKDEGGNEIVPITEEPKKYFRQLSDFIPNSPDSSRAVSRETTEVRTLTPLWCKRPKVISVTMREHGGQQSESPYSIMPSQAVIPARGHRHIQVNFTPFATEEVTECMDCNGFAIGYLNLPDEHVETEGEVGRPQGYSVQPLRLQMTGQVKPALLTIECAEDDGMSYRAAASDLMHNEQMMGRSLKLCSATLRNQTETSLVFRLKSSQPFFLADVDTASGTIQDQHLQSQPITLLPRSNMPVQVAFCVDQDLLQGAETLPNEDDSGVELEQQGPERKLHFRQELLIEFNNKSIQRIPLMAMLTMPNLALSKEVLDFSTCLVGQRRELQLILSNPTGSDSYWMCTLESRSKTCQAGTFEVTPGSGKLDAFITHVSDNKVLIRVFFTAQHTETYEATYIFHGMLGEQPRKLLLKGQGSYDGKHEALVNV